MAERNMIKCPRCSWSRVVGDDPKEVTDLYEYKGCLKCNNFKKFRCPKCGRMAKQLPIRG